MKSNARYALLLSATLLLAFGQARDPRLMPQGFPEVLEDTETTFDQLGAATLDVDAALDQLDALAEGEADSPPAARSEAQASIARLEARSEKLQKSVEKMNDRADTFFKKWEDSLEKMNDIERVSSVEMRDDLWDRYRKIADDGARSEVELRPVIADLKKLLERFEAQAGAEGANNRREAFDELQTRTVHWLEEVRNRYRDAEKQLQALEGEVDGDDQGTPRTDGGL
jgi:chromosome segregation ATPase